MTIVSPQWMLIDEDRKKLLRSAGWAVLAVLAYALAEYLKQFGLPEQMAFAAPFVPVVINALLKWAKEHEYIVER